MKCKSCSAEFEPFSQHNSTIKQKLCVQCLIAKGNEKRAKTANSVWRKEKSALKEKLKTKSEWLNDFQKSVNKIARLIDFCQPCIATGSFNGKMNGGHFAAVGSFPAIRFNLHNIHIQSEHSNSFKGGDNLKYADGIEKVYGIEYLNYIHSLRKINGIKLSIDDIKEKIEISKDIIKELSNEKIYSPKERIALRNKFNKKFGIYE